MNLLPVVYQSDRWLAFDGQHWIALEDHPELERPAVVLCDLPGAISGVMTLKTSRAHAAASVEKSLRTDGLLDGESNVVIHHAERAGSGCRVLYTALPTEAWQRALAWAEGQRDHCLLVPPAGVLWRGLRSGEGAVLRTGRQLAFVGRIQQRPFHARAIALSEHEDEMAMAARTLGRRVAEQLSRVAETMEVRWLWLDSAAATGDIDERTLTDAFASGGDRSVRLSAQARLSTVLAPWLLRPAAVAAINPPLSRAACLAERGLPWLSAASIVAAAGLFGLGLAHAGKRTDVAAQAERAQAQAQDLRQELPALREAGRLPPDLEPTLEFLGRVQGVQAGSEPVRTIADIGQAAGSQLRILRIRSDLAALSPAIVAEGRVPDHVGDQPLALFVERLRQAGYRPEAIDTGGAGSNQPAGFFAYRLTPLAPYEAVGQGGMP